MTEFDPRKYKTQEYARSQIVKYISNSKRDLDIAKKSENAMIVFKFAYDAVLKAGIALIANLGFRVRAIAGHHIEILHKMHEILGEDFAESVMLFEDLRRQRNKDLYEGGVFVSDSEAEEYKTVAEKLVKEVAKRIE